MVIGAAKGCQGLVGYFDEVICWTFFGRSSCPELFCLHIKCEILVFKLSK